MKFKETDLRYHMPKAKQAKIDELRLKYCELSLEKAIVLSRNDDKRAKKIDKELADIEHDYGVIINLVIDNVIRQDFTPPEPVKTVAICYNNETPEPAA